MARRKKYPETIDGQYLAIPRKVKRSDAYQACSNLAKALLIELIDQHNGENNGRLHLTYSHLLSQGFSSKDQISKGREELIAKKLIVLTKQGGLPMRSQDKKLTFGGPSWFALTWFQISNFIGLDICSSQFKRGAWNDFVKVEKRAQPEALKLAQQKRAAAARGTGKDWSAPRAGS
jgi:hypothetical protein